MKKTPKQALEDHERDRKAREKASRPVAWLRSFNTAVDLQARLSCLGVLALRRMTLARYPVAALESAFALGGDEAVDALVRDARLAAFRLPTRPPSRR